jgi:arylsulfatase A-like enzyme
MGAGIKPGRYDQAATPADIAPTLAKLCGITLPKAEGRPLTAALR